MVRANYFLCLIILIPFGGCVSVDVTVKGRTFGGVLTSSIDPTKPPVEIPDLPFENKQTTLIGPNGEVIVEPTCDRKDQLSNVNPRLAIAQETVFWCWAASPQMVIKFNDPNNNLMQCQIVTDVKYKDRSRDGAPFCCNKPTNIACLQNGRPEDVLIKNGYTFTPWIYSRDKPLRATQINGLLCKNGIFPHIVLLGDNGGHVVNVTNIRKVGDAISVEVFDPLRESFRPIPYESFIEGYIEENGIKYEIDRDLVLINKPQ